MTSVCPKLTATAQRSLARCQNSKRDIHFEIEIRSFLFLFDHRTAPWYPPPPLPPSTQMSYRNVGTVSRICLIAVRLVGGQ